MHALADKGDIVDKFVHGDYNDFSFDPHIFDLQVSGNCDSSSVSSSAPAYYNRNNRRVCLISTDNFGTILHELGHAFGLADTYVPPLEYNVSRHRESDGGSDRTVGMQPVSVMCCSNLYIGEVQIDELGRPYSRVQLSADDIAGIRHAYDHWVKSNSNRDDERRICPEDHAYEGNTEGCLPLGLSTPFIDAIKAGDSLSEFIKFSGETDSKIYVYAQEVDSEGNTPLHHLTMRANTHADSRSLYHHYYHKLSDLIRKAYRDGYLLEKLSHYKTKKNTRGHTPVDIFQLISIDVYENRIVDNTDVEIVKKHMGKDLYRKASPGGLPPAEGELISYDQRMSDTYREMARADVNDDGVIDAKDV